MIGARPAQHRAVRVGGGLRHLPERQAEQLRELLADARHALRRQHRVMPVGAGFGQRARDRGRRMAEHRAGVAEAEIDVGVAVDVFDFDAARAAHEQRMRRAPVAHPVHGHAVEPVRGAGLREPRGLGVRGREGFALARREPAPALRCRCRDAARSSRRRYLRALRARFGLGLGALRARGACAAASLAFSALAARLFAASALASGLRRRPWRRPSRRPWRPAFVSVLASSLSAPARLRLFSLSRLKSVSYQPEPFSRNTGADMSFLQPVLAAVRALLEWLVVDLLQHLFVVAAVRTFVFVERHVAPRNMRRDYSGAASPAAREDIFARICAV